MSMLVPGKTDKWVHKCHLRMRHRRWHQSSSQQKRERAHPCHPSLERSEQSHRRLTMSFSLKNTFLGIYHLTVNPEHKAAFCSLVWIYVRHIEANKWKIRKAFWAESERAAACFEPVLALQLLGYKAISMWQERRHSKKKIRECFLRFAKAEVASLLAMRCLHSRNRKCTLQGSLGDAASLAPEADIESQCKQLQETPTNG